MNTIKTIYCYVRQLQGAVFNVIHFELAILLVWVVGGVANNCGLVSCGLDSVNNETFCAVANILCGTVHAKQVDRVCAARVSSENW
jgi:hypothetical protein